MMALIVLGLLGIILGLGLAFASQKFKIEEDPRLEEILAVLPGSNCGVCGYAGCRVFAEAALKNPALASGCLAGGAKTAQEVAKILGVQASDREKFHAQVYCWGGKHKAKRRYTYTGVPDCRLAATLAGGHTECAYGCLGLGDCVRSCPFEAIKIGKDELPVVDLKKCIGCAKCVDACPRNIIHLVPARSQRLVFCSSHDKGPRTKAACPVGCIVCGLCVKACPENAVKIDEFLAVIDPKLCTDCGQCEPVCPVKVIGEMVYSRPKIQTGRNDHA